MSTSGKEIIAPIPNRHVGAIDVVGGRDKLTATPGEFCEFCQFCGATGMDLDIRACPSGENGEFHNTDLSEALRDILRISEGRDDDRAELLVGRWIITHPKAVAMAKGVIKKTEALASSTTAPDPAKDGEE